MKTNNVNNPEINNQNNLPAINPIANHEHYERQKKERKTIQEKRKALQQTVAMMKREAKESNKKFQETQDNLMQLYNKKLSTLQQTTKKNQYLRHRQQELQRKRNFSNLTRYLHQIKKDQAINNLAQQKKNAMKHIKSNLEQAHNKKRLEKQKYLTFLFEKTRNMSLTNRNNIHWARKKSFDKKNKQSKSVRNSLISIEQTLIAKQNQKISLLQKQKQQYLKMLQRNRQKFLQIQVMKDQLDNMDLQQFQSRVVQNKQDSRITDTTRKITKQRKKSLRERKKNYETLFF